MQAVFEKITRSGEASFRCFERRDSGFPFAWHYHPECELTLILDSRGKRFVGDQIEAYDAGDLVLLGADLPHTWASESSPEHPDREDRAVVIQFEPDFWGERFFNLPEMRVIRLLLNRSVRGLHFDRQEAEPVAKRIEAMPGLTIPERLPELIQILQLLARMKSVRALTSEGFVPSLHQADQHRIDLVFRHLNDHYIEKITQDKIARLVRMNTASFCRFFKKMTGKTMTGYVNELRTAMACRLLMETDLGVLEICYRVGFNNLSNFNRQFRKLKGCSPGLFRRRFLAEARKA